jgi:outer membrane murein-binding lipoprotein Lpp
MQQRSRVGLTAAVSAVAILVGCSSTPSTDEEVCGSFNELGTQVLEGNGIIGNPLFKKVDELANVVGRYEGQPDLSADAEALHEIADSDSTSGEELMNATMAIANLCGHPLGTNALFGSG